MSLILGFDISSETLAYALLREEPIELIEVNYIKPIKEGSVINKLYDTRNRIEEVIRRLNPNHIVIEDIIQFMPKMSTSKTIITLTSFNRMIGLLSFDLLNKEPELVSVLSIRNIIKKNLQLKKMPKKEEIPELLETLLNIKFPWEYTKKSKIKKENYDKADAIACAYYLVNKLKKKI